MRGFGYRMQGSRLKDQFVFVLMGFGIECILSLFFWHLEAGQVSSRVKKVVFRNQGASNYLISKTLYKL